MKIIKCPCQSIPITNSPIKFENFASLRESCPALREVLLPENIWHDYQNMVKTNNDESRQLPIVLGAFNEGLLARITMPVHDYLLDGETLNVNLTNQYKKDLNEKWILERDQLTAYQKFRIFKGNILFKIFEAAKQLTKCTNSRLSLVVVDSVDWDFLEMPIRDKWIISRPIRFSNSADRDWKKFLEQKKLEKRFVTVENELDEAIGGLKECWILKETYMTFVLDEKIELHQNN
jgi:hypothetical protein